VAHKIWFSYNAEFRRNGTKSINLRLSMHCCGPVATAYTAMWKWSWVRANGHSRRQPELQTSFRSLSLTCT